MPQLKVITTLIVKGAVMPFRRISFESLLILTFDFNWKLVGETIADKPAPMLPG